MPTVPTFINQRNLANVPDVRLPHYAESPVEGAFVGMSRTVGGIANQVQQINDRRVDAEASANFAEVSTEGNGELNGYVDPESGQVVPGALARLGYDANGVSQGFAKKAKDWSDAYQAKMSPGAWKIFKPRFDMLVSNSMERLTSHEAGQMRQGDVETFLGTSQTLQQNALTNWTDDGAFNGQLEAGTTELRKALALKGLPEAEVNAQAAAYQNATVAQRVQSAVADKRYVDARTILGDPRLQQAQKDELAGHIDNAEKQLAAEQRMMENAARIEMERQAKAARDQANGAVSSLELAVMDGKLSYSDYRARLIDDPALRNADEQHKVSSIKSTETWVAAHGGNSGVQFSKTTDPALLRDLTQLVTRDGPGAMAAVSHAIENGGQISQATYLHLEGLAKTKVSDAQKAILEPLLGRVDSVAASISPTVGGPGSSATHGGKLKLYYGTAAQKPGAVAPADLFADPPGHSKTMTADEYSETVRQAYRFVELKPNATTQEVKEWLGKWIVPHENRIAAMTYADRLKDMSQNLDSAATWNRQISVPLYRTQVDKYLPKKPGASGPFSVPATTQATE